MKFVKMHGCGNDGVFLDALAEPRIAEMVEGRGWAEFVRGVCHRHRGIGADFVVVMSGPGEGAAGAAARMRIFNADGLEAQMCSTGVRGVAKMLVDRGVVAGDVVNVQTGRGVLEVRVRRDEDGRIGAATVSMGAPILERERIPTRLGVGERAIDVTLPDDLAKLLGEQAAGANAGPLVSCVSMGNPHVVVWCGNAAGIWLRTVGPAFEGHEAFPERVNAHFVKVVSRSEVIARHWERGAGMTQACGTGSCAIVVAGVLTGRLERRVRVRVPGGEFEIEWAREGGPVVLSGAIEEVFEGTIAEPAEGAGVVRGPTLRTERLVLRPFERTDVEAVASMLESGVIARQTLRIPHPYTRADAEKWIGTLAGGSKPVFAVCLKDGRLIGAIGLEMQAEHRKAMLGYWIGEKHWGKGYATEAVGAVLEHGFGALGLARIDAYHYPENPASGRVMEKAGLKKEGVLREYVVKEGKGRDCVMYAVVKEEWGNRK